VLSAAADKINVPCQRDIRVAWQAVDVHVDRIDFVDDGTKHKYRCSIMNDLFKPLPFQLPNRYYLFLTFGRKMVAFAEKL